jgi:RNA polymerase sigma-70 factor (ECF subfamily)
MPRTDAQLLVAMHKGDETAARELWARHAAALVAYARSVLRWSGQADDAVQAVFCRVLELDRGTLAGVADGRAWLVSLVRREALNQLRSLRRERARRRAASRVEATHDASRAGGADEALERAVDALPRRLREVVVLRHRSGLSFDQMAEALGLNRNTAAGRYRRAMVELRSMLGGVSAAEAEHV